MVFNATCCLESHNFITLNCYKMYVKGQIVHQDIVEHIKQPMQNYDVIYCGLEYHVHPKKCPQYSSFGGV